MNCSTDFVRTQLQALAKVKQVALLRQKVTSDVLQATIDAYSGEIAKRFDGETVARACHELATRFKGWPELYDVLDACRDAQNEHQRRVERHRSRESGTISLADSLRDAGLPTNCLAGIAKDRWAALLDLHQTLNPNDLRTIVEALQSGERLEAKDGAWSIGRRRQNALGAAGRIEADLAELEAHGTINGQSCGQMAAALAKLGASMLARRERRGDAA